MPIGRLLLRIGDLVPILRAAVSQQPIGQQVEAIARVGDLERVRIMIGRPLPRRVAPVHELGTLLERRAAATDQVGLVDPDRRQRSPDRRERSLADTEDADVARFDERDRDAARKVRAEPLGEIARRQPPGGAAAHDQYPLGHHSLASPLADRCRRAAHHRQKARLIPVLIRRSAWNQLRPTSLPPG